MDSDYALALQLQEQYDRANENKSKPNFTSPVKSLQSQQKNNLGSPSWELSDPTPNVHALFQQFDRTFFWGKLSRVVVRWSKRMYSCAGICRYEGRAGFCDIALSEPLLKLRPRKDLVETLLHEMIHAFLFLTNNDRDRDGHGPNFLQHMHRINRAANINISVYHDFHDEVKLYKTHWWRCNGPCQNQKPFFGTVRRSCNRAPGPSDFWWAEHRARCSGSFIKIREPEKKLKENTLPKTTKDSKAPDIRSYINPTKSFANKDERQTVGGASSIYPISNKTNTSLTQSFDNISKNSSIALPIITKPNVKDNNKIIGINNTTKGSVSVTGNIINTQNKSPEKSVSLDVRETVRNHWADKFYTNSKKRPFETDSMESKPNKIMKTESVAGPSVTTVDKPSGASERSKNRSLFYSLPSEMVKDCNNILSDLYGEGFTLDSKNFKSSPVDSKNWRRASQIHDLSTTACPICNNMFSLAHIDMHLKECIGNDEFNDSNPLVDTSGDIIDLTNFNECTKPSQLKNKSTSTVIDLTDFDDRSACASLNSTMKMNMSGLNLDDNSALEMSVTEESSPKKSESTAILEDYCSCPICNKLISRSEADDHLEQCVSTTFMNDDNNFDVSQKSMKDDDASSVHSDDIDESSEYNVNGTKITCPGCFFLVEESLMNTHLDTCLL